MAIISPHGSLSKEFPLHTIVQTIGAARSGMNMVQLKAIAPMPDLGPFVCARWLLFQNGQLIRDRFLSLSETEGLESARMRKIMYGVFALRDSRIREFITQRIASRAGTWRTAEVVNKSNSTYFDGASRTKVRSNLERLLGELGVYNHSTRMVHLELADGWLQDSVAVVSQYENDPAVRALMLAEPINYIISQGLQGLAHATVEQLRAIAPNAQPDAEAGEDALIQQVAPLRGNAFVGQSWNRQEPQFQDRQTAAVFQNAVARERASRAHHSIEHLLVNAVRAAGGNPQTTINIDVYFALGGVNFVAEIKSCHQRNVHSQTRRGISQLLEYDHLYGDGIGRPVTKMLVLEMQPLGSKAWLVQYLTGLNILVCWRSTDRLRLESTAAIPAVLEGIIHPLAG